MGVGHARGAALVQALEREGDLVEDGEELRGVERLGLGVRRRAVEQRALGERGEDEIRAARGVRDARFDLGVQEREHVGVLEASHDRHLALDGGDVLVLAQEDALEGEVLPARVRDLAREVHEAESALAELTMHGEATALHRHLLRGEHLARGIREEAPEVAQGGAAPHEGVHARKTNERAGARRDEVGRDEGRQIGSRDVREVARDES